jgi:leucyl-tRNA synthetase
LTNDGILHEVSPLPLELPDVKDFKPSGDGSSPIAKATEWINATPGLSEGDDTMPGFAGSSWYFLRYILIITKLHFPKALSIIGKMWTCILVAQNTQ